MVALLLVFWGPSILFSIVAAPIYIPTNSVQGFLFSTAPSVFVICRLFDDGHSDGCEALSDCDCDLHFSDDQQHWAFFSCACWPSVYHLNSWVREIPWRRNRLPSQVFLGFPGGSERKESTCNVEDLSSIPGFGRSPWGGPGNPLQYSCLENPMDRGAWWAAVQGGAEQLFLVCKPQKCLHCAPSSSFMIAKT